MICFMLLLVGVASLVLAAMGIHAVFTSGEGFFDPTAPRPSVATGASAQCTAELFEDPGYKGALLDTLSTHRAEEAFVLPSSVEEFVSSIRLSGACDSMEVFDEDNCEEGSMDNVVYTADVYELPPDLDNDVCKIAIHANATCAQPDFQCENGKCISGRATDATTHVNNGANDCADWSDEFCTEEWGREDVCANISATQCGAAQGSMPQVFDGLVEYDAAATISSACPRTCGTCASGACA